MVEISGLFLLFKSRLFQKRTDCVNNGVSPPVLLSTVYSKPEVVTLASDNIIKEYMGKKKPSYLNICAWKKVWESVKTKDDCVLSWVLSFCKKWRSPLSLNEDCWSKVLWLISVQRLLCRHCSLFINMTNSSELLRIAAWVELWSCCLIFEINTWKYEGTNI